MAKGNKSSPDADEAGDARDVAVSNNSSEALVQDGVLVQYDGSEPLVGSFSCHLDYIAAAPTLAREFLTISTLLLHVSWLRLPCLPKSVFGGAFATIASRQ